MIHRQVRKLETFPALCVWATVLWVVFGLPLLLFPGAPAWLKTVGALSGVAAIVVWLASARAFASNCRHQPGWHIPILELHAVAVLFIGPFAGLLGACGLAAIGANAFALATALGSVMLIVLGVIIYRDARQRLAVLQRKTAVELARGELAKPKYLRRFPSGLPRDQVPPDRVS